jgi:dipeptide transport system ATP-binding protein
MYKETPRMADTTTPVLMAENLTRHYRVSRGWLRGHAMVRALNGVSLTLHAGKTLAVVGESGSGKSTLARLLCLIDPPTSGSLALDGIDPTQAKGDTLKSLRSKIQMVFQNPYASLNPRQRVATMLEEPLKLNTALDRTARQQRVAAMLERVGLRPEHAQRYPHMFSGGQRQRIAIARAMILNPSVVVADEPVSALDVSIQAQVLNLFMDLQAEFGTSYVFISHNLAVVEHIADEVLVMYLGAAVEQGDKRAIFARPLHPYTRALMQATPTMHGDDGAAKLDISGDLPSPLAPPNGCAFHPRCPYAEARCRGEVPTLRPIEGRTVACHLAEKIES